LAEAVAHLPLRRAAGWLARPSPAVRFGLRYGTGIAAALWLANASGLSQAQWIVITVVFVMQPSQGGSVEKGLLRIAGTIAAALVSILLYGLFSQDPPLLLAGVILATALGIFLKEGPRHQYAGMVFAFTTLIILVDALKGTDAIETLAFQRASLVALGCLVCFATDVLLWPMRAEEPLRRGFAGRARQLADALKPAVESLLAGRSPGRTDLPLPSSPLVQELGRIDQLRMEIGVSEAEAQVHTRISLLLEALASRVRVLGTNAAARLGAPAPQLHAALSELAGCLGAALGEVGAALTAGRAPSSSAGRLEQALAGFESARLGAVEAAADGDPRAGPVATISAQAPVLADVVALVTALEEAAGQLAGEEARRSGEQGATEAPSLRSRLVLDPIRVELALRGGIAAGCAVLAMLALGWSVNPTGAIVAYLAASGPTRGAGRLVLLVVGLAGLLGWLLADLGSVYVYPHAGRMPLALLAPFALAGTLGYLAVRRPKLEPLRALTLMLAISPMLGAGPPHDVQSPYDTTTVLFLGIATGLVVQRLLWPRTAARIFRERAATQLELCARPLAGGVQGRAVAELTEGHARQLALLGQVHQQAHLEPVEDALDDGRRAELLTLTQDLFDASLRAGRVLSGGQEPAPGEAEAALRPLQEALAREYEAMVASMNAAARALRGLAPAEASGLSEARAAVEARAAALRGRTDLARALGARRTDAFLARLTASRQLVETQLRVEAWLLDWRAAVAGLPGSA
jgi:uncharacterized membrane protein YccC